MTEHDHSGATPTGLAVPNWKPCSPPPSTLMAGRYCRLERLNTAAHATDLFQSFAKATNALDWYYLSYDPSGGVEQFKEFMDAQARSEDPRVFAILDQDTSTAVGLASYMRIKPEIGVLEVGGIHYSPQIQSTPIGTEAMYLMMRRAFDELSYRRYEWKCDALNARSRKAALRLGFTFEGIFRQATLYKGRNRDTAWYSVIDKEWPVLKVGFEAWLSESNFDSTGQQIDSLAALTMRLRDSET